MHPHNGEDDDTNPSASEGELPDVSLSLDAILSLLANQQRRDLLHYLTDSSAQTAPLDECVGHLMEREEERSGQRSGHDQVEKALHHVHIPKLADAGLLEYDVRSQVVRYYGHEHLESWLGRIQADESEPD